MEGYNLGVWYCIPEMSNHKLLKIDQPFEGREKLKTHGNAIGALPTNKKTIDIEKNMVFFTFTGWGVGSNYENFLSNATLPLLFLLE